MRQKGGEAVMVWGAITSKETIGVNRIEGKMVFEYYCTVIEKGLLPAFEESFGDVWTLMHDGPVSIGPTIPWTGFKPTTYSQT